ncbi:MAG: MXAN_5187 C-terminal domain-containing protein, partial [Myxococcota bacterium]
MSDRMTFWLRHSILLVLCVVAPFTAALYFDTTSTVEQAKETSRRSLQLAVPSLTLLLQNEAYRAVGSVTSAAQRTVASGSYRGLTRSGSRRDEAVKNLVGLLAEIVPRRGFAWIVDAKGRVVLTDRSDGLEESPKSVQGHPVFVETQLGYALDGVWSAHDELVLVAAAPLLDDGEVTGALLVGRTVDRDTVGEWAEALRGHVTLTKGNEVLVSSAPSELAETVVAAALDAVSPVYAGSRPEPLTDGTIPFLPLMIDHKLAEEAFVSFGTPVFGSLNQLQWVISVDASAGLTNIAERQSAVLGTMLAAFLVALLIGILYHRSYVAPSDRIAEHLSELQMGRGDLEMPEASVSQPFRRLVRLINMTVQKLPNRGLALPTADIGSIARSAAEDGIPAPPVRPMPLTPDASPMGQASGTATLPSDRDRPHPTHPPAVAGPTLEQIEADDGLVPHSLSLDSLPPSPVAGHSASLSSSLPHLSSDRLPIPQPARSNGDLESNDATEAAMMPPSADVPDFAALGIPSTPGAEAAIADAIAQLEGAQASEEQTPGSRRSAAEIRGRPMMGAADMSTPFEDVSIPPTGSIPGVRGGGSLDLGQSAALPSEVPDRGQFGPEETVVAPVATELLARSAREDLTGRHAVPGEKPDATVVANVPADLLAQSAQEMPTPIARGASLITSEQMETEDRSHFQEVYERFIDLRRRCGESTADLAFDRFISKLSRNRDTLVKKYNCRTVRFQVYQKD